jgi:hypothetical protein
MLLVGGNVNICLGVSLVDTGLIERSLYYVAVFVQAIVVLPVWYFWGREGKSVLDVVSRKGKVEMGRRAPYMSVDQGGEEEAFIVSGLEIEYELDEDKESSLQKGGE